MSDFLHKISHLDFDPKCEAPGHWNAFTRDMKAAKALRNMHKCARNVAPILACLQCAKRIRDYTLINCPKCGESYPGEAIRADDLPGREKIPEWG